MTRGLEPDYTPTPEQIKAACSAIQDEWDETEENKRRIGCQDSFPAADDVVHRPGVDVSKIQ